MNQRIVLSLFHAVLLASVPATSLLSTNDDGTFDDREATYNVVTKLLDDVKESTFAIKLKCRPRTIDILTCVLSDPHYETVYHKTPCVNSSLCDDEHLTVDGSYVGNFEIKFRRSSVKKLTVSSETSLKQLSMYRIMANHLFLGVNVIDKPDGTYSMFEDSVYGNCAAIVKIVHALSQKIVADGNDDRAIDNQLVSVTRTRNLDTCYPVPGLLLYDAFFYHPMMASVHYEIKSSISRFIVTKSSFTSYTTEDIAVKNLDGGGNTTMLHVRTTLTQQSLAPATDPIPRIIDPVTVALPFVDGFPIKSIDASGPKPTKICNKSCPPEPI